jgi:hypothetical protein
LTHQPNTKRSPSQRVGQTGRLAGRHVRPAQPRLRVARRAPTLVLHRAVPPSQHPALHSALHPQPASQPADEPSKFRCVPLGACAQPCRPPPAIATCRPTVSPPTATGHTAQRLLPWSAVPSPAHGVVGTGAAVPRSCSRSEPQHPCYRAVVQGPGLQTTEAHRRSCYGQSPAPWR